MDPATTFGAAGNAGGALITTLADASEVHPAPLVTVNVYVFGARPDMVVLDVLPGMLPGFIVHEPAGKPSRVTEPVGVVQFG